MLGAPVGWLPGWFAVLRGLAPAPGTLASCETNYIFNSSWAPNETICLPAAEVGSLCLGDPLVLPSGVMAFFEGAAVFSLFASTPGIRAPFTMGAIFLLYAVMMSLGGVSHSLVTALHFSSSSQYALGLSVSALTSAIASLFAVVGLVDAGLLGENSTPTKALTLAAPPVFFAAYYLLADVPNAFWVLYVDVIMVCCGFFVVVECCRLVRNPPSPTAVAVLVAGAGVGAAGLWACSKGVVILCASSYPLVSAEAVWYATSNAAVAAVAGYWYLTRRTADEIAAASKGAAVEPAV